MKKNEELLHIIGDIDDDMIEKSKPEKIRKKRTVQIGILSSAAIITLVLGLQYKFIFKPLSDAGGEGNINNSVTVTSEVSETDIEEKEITQMTESVFPYESNIYEIHNGGMRVIRFLPSDDEGFLCAVEKSDFTAAEGSVGYYTFEEGGNKYYLDASKTILHAEWNFTVTENYFYAHLNKGLFSFSRSDGHLINEDYSFHGEMEQGYYDTMLGADNDENIYMLQHDYTNGDKYTLLKYSPELELLSSEDTYIGERENNISGVYRGDPVFTIARGFDSINLSYGKINILYSDDCILEYDLASREYSSDCEFSFETKNTDAEAGIYKGGKYLYAKDRNGETVLKCFFNIDENGTGFTKEYTEDEKAIYTYIDGEILIGSEQEGTYDNIIEIQKYDVTGKMIDSHVAEDEEELVPEQERIIRELYTNEDGTIKNVKNTDSALEDYYYLKNFSVADNGDLLCVFEIGRINAQVNFVNPPESEEYCRIGIISPSGEFTEITEKTIREHMKSGSVIPSPQKDGTFVYIHEGVMYSYDVQKNETTALCEPGGYYDRLDGDILKVNDTTYVLPISAFSSSLDKFYIMNLEAE